MRGIVVGHRPGAVHADKSTAKADCDKDNY
jgi:hypothetical protein